MRVLVDVDGVVADYTKRYLECLEMATGRKHAAGDITTWEYRDCLGLTKEEEKEIDALLAQDLDFEEMPGAVQAVREIVVWDEVVFVTSPSYHIPEWTHWRQKWLEMRFPRVPVIHTKHKELIPGDVLIDDRPENLKLWLRKYPSGAGMLWSASYNARDGVPTGVIRVGEWAEVKRLLNLLRGGRE